MTSLRSRVSAHRYIALSIAAIAFVLFWGLPTLVIPFAGDQSWFALGARSILDGDRLYRDFHDQKSPLIFFLYAVPQAIAGDGREAVRVFDMANTLLAMAGVFFLARRFLAERAAVLAAAAYAFVYLTTVGLDGLAETESFIVTALVFALAIYPVRRGNQALVMAFASGLLLGLAFGLKFSVAPFVLALPAMELLLRDRQTWRPIDAVWRLVAAAVGFLLVQAIWVGYLVLAGTLDDFIDIQRYYTIPYQNIRWTPNEWSYPRFGLVSSEEWLSKAWYISLPGLAGLLLLLTRGPRAAGYVFGLLLAFAVISVWWQSKFFYYHWIITLPFFAVLTGYVLHLALDAVSESPRNPRIFVGVTALAGGVLLLAAPLIATFDAYNYLYDRTAGTITQAEIDATYSPVLELNHQLVDYVTANSRSDEGFAVWGTWPQVLLWADRPSPSNFVTSPALRASFAPDKWRREYVEDLEANPPRFFAVSEGDFQPWLTDTDRSSRQDFCDHYPELRQFIEEDYLPVFYNGLFFLYDRDAMQARTAGACD